jgi:hypothetical protein
MESALSAGAALESFESFFEGSMDVEEVWGAVTSGVELAVGAELAAGVDAGVLAGA